VFVFLSAKQPRIYIEEGWYEKKELHIRMLKKFYGILANYGWQTKTVFSFSGLVDIHRDGDYVGAA